MQVFVHKTGLMHAMTAAASRGYVAYAMGRIRPQKAPGLAERFAGLYGTECSPTQRSRAKSAGKAGARLFMHPDYREHAVHWWLLLTEGEHPARSREKIRDLCDKRQRLVVFGQFEAIQLPKEGAAPTWTWHLAGPYFADQAMALRETIRRRGDSDGELAAQIAAIHRFPGFRGIRDDVRKLRQFITAEWRRTKAADTAPPLPEKVQGYVRAKTFRTVSLELVIQRMAEGLPPFADDWRYPQEGVTP